MANLVKRIWMGNSLSIDFLPQDVLCGTRNDTKWAFGPWGYLQTFGTGRLMWRSS